MAPLAANVEHESAPAIQLDFNTNQNPDSSLNSNVIPNPILDKSLDQALGAQALSPGSPSVNTAPLNNPLQASLDPSLFDLNDEPSSPTQALRLLEICQTPNLATIQPPTLSPSHSSPSVASSIQHFNTLDAHAQTPPRRNSQSSPFSRMEETLNTIKADLHDFKRDNAKTT